MSTQSTMIIILKIDPYICPKNIFPLFHEKNRNTSKPRFFWFGRKSVKILYSSFHNFCMAGGKSSRRSKQRRGTGNQYGTGYEANAVRRELGNFDARSSQAWEVLIDKFGVEMRLFEIVKIAQILYQRFPMKLTKISRNASRSMPLIVKWYQENLNAILPYLNCFTLCDEDQKEIRRK